MADQDDPAVMQLLGQVYTHLGDTAQAATHLDRALAACYPVENAWYGPFRASILRDYGELAALTGDDDKAIMHYSQAFEMLSKVASGFQWNTQLRDGLADELSATGDSLATLLDKQGRKAEAEEVRHRCQAGKIARDYLLADTPVPDDEARDALNAYRTAATYLDTLRFDLYWNAGVGMGKRFWPWEAYSTMYEYKWNDRRAYVNQFLSLRKDIEKEIERVNMEANGHLAKLRELAPQVAAVIELEATEAWWEESND